MARSSPPIKESRATKIIQLKRTDALNRAHNRIADAFPVFITFSLFMGFSIENAGNLSNQFRLAHRATSSISKWFTNFFWETFLKLLDYVLRNLSAYQLAIALIEFLIGKIGQKKRHDACCY